MKKRLLCSCITVLVLLVLGLSACSGGDAGSIPRAPAIAKVRMWITLSNNPDAPPVTTLTPEQTALASIWARGTTEEKVTFKISLYYDDKFTTLMTNVRTEGSKAIAAGGFATPLEPGKYTFKAVSGAMGAVIGSLEITVVVSLPPASPSTTPSEITTSPSATPSSLSEEPDKATFQKYFSNMGLGKIPSGGKLPQDLQQNATVFTAGDQISLYFSVTQEVQVRTTIYDIEAKKVVKEGGFPMSLTPSNYAGAEPLTIPAGKYEYKVYANDVLVAVLPFEVLAATSSQPSPTSSILQPDKATFSIYFKDMGLGKITTGGKLPQELQQNVTVFAGGDQLTLYGNIIKECQQPRYEIYYVQANKVVKGGGLSFPTIKPGFDAVGFISVDTLNVPVGNYEYKVFVGDILVGIFPFEVR